MNLTVTSWDRRGTSVLNRSVSEERHVYVSPEKASVFIAVEFGLIGETDISATQEKGTLAGP